MIPVLSTFQARASKVLCNSMWIARLIRQVSLLFRFLFLVLSLSQSFFLLYSFLTDVEFSDDISILNQNIKHQIITSHLNVY